MLSRHACQLHVTCSADTTCAPAVTGSIDRCGIAPWPPVPSITASNVVDAAMITPACTSMMVVQDDMAMSGGLGPQMVVLVVAVNSSSRCKWDRRDC